MWSHFGGKVTHHGFPSFYQAELGKTWSSSSWVLDCIAMIGISLQKHFWLFFSVTLTQKKVELIDYLSLSGWVPGPLYVNSWMDWGKDLFWAFITGICLCLKPVSVFCKVISRVTKYVLKVLPYPVFYFKDSIPAAEWSSGFITNATHNASVALHTCIRFLGCWDQGSDKWERSKFMGMLTWLHTNTKFLPLLRVSGRLYAWLQPCHICTDFGSNSEKIHPAREASMGLLIFFILNFLFIFLKCVGTEAFFLCATAACLKSMFEYGSTFKLCGQSEFLPKPMVEP